MAEYTKNNITVPRVKNMGEFAGMRFVAGQKLTQAQAKFLKDRGMSARITNEDPNAPKKEEK